MALTQKFERRPDSHADRFAGPTFSDHQFAAIVRAVDGYPCDLCGLVEASIATGAQAFCKRCAPLAEAYRRLHQHDDEQQEG